MRSIAVGALVASFALAGCAGILGFQDLRLVDSGADGADASSDDGTVGDDAEVDGASDARADARSMDGGPARDGAGLRDGPPEAEPGDASDAASPCNPSFCPTGCCTSAGQCAAGTAVAACGGGGASCQDCSTRSCPLTEAPCCKTGGGCGCAIGAVVGCN
jgi:hypothetical protein